MTRIASLGMYDFPPLRGANDALWSLIAERLAARGLAGVPARLERGRPLDAIWSAPDLLLAQCCGYPLATRYRGRLLYVATPHYAVPGCTGADHRSRIVVRASDPARALSDLRGGRAAINDRLSNTGANLFRSALAPIAQGAPFFGAVVETGSHEASLEAVAAGQADVAAIDAVSFAHLARGRPTLVAAVRTLGWTDPSPGLPFVTSGATTPADLRLLRETLDEVARSAPARPALDALLVHRVERLPDGTYDRLLRLEERAVRLGYPQLA